MAVILVIDDDADFLESLCEILSQSGHQVMGHARADSALLQLEQRMPDLLITDLVMPVMNGAEFLLTVQDTYSGFPCPVIAMSGGGRFDTVPVFDSIKDMPVDAVLRKPFSLDVLEAHISDLLTGG